MAIRVEHAGAKGSGASTGYWGKRAEVKAITRKLRRSQARKAERAGKGF